MLFLVEQKQQEGEAPYAEGNDAVTGHIISTTIGGKNGEPKRVRHEPSPPLCCFGLGSIS